MLRMAFTLYSSPPKLGGGEIKSSPPKLGGVRGGLNEQRDNPLFRPPLAPPNLGGEIRCEVPPNLGGEKDSTNGLIFMQEYNLRKLNNIINLKL